MGLVIGEHRACEVLQEGTLRGVDRNVGHRDFCIDTDRHRIDLVSVDEDGGQVTTLIQRPLNF